MRYARLLVLAFSFVVLGLACIQAPASVVPTSPPPTIAPVASTSAAAAPSVLIADAGVDVVALPAAAAPAPVPKPEYHAGDFRLMLPTGRTVVPTVDGGSYAVVDGNERPCDYGCTAAYASVGQTVYQRYGKPLAEVSPGDYAVYLRDYEACTKSCKPLDKVYWPGSR